jgi:hypothetical protein
LQEISFGLTSRGDLQQGSRETNEIWARRISLPPRESIGSIGDHIAQRQLKTVQSLASETADRGQLPRFQDWSGDRWPDLPESPSGEPSIASGRAALSGRSRSAAGEETLPSAGSGRATRRWPELLQEPASNRDEWHEWTEVLRAWQRASRLDREQRGGD